MRAFSPSQNSHGQITPKRTLQPIISYFNVETTGKVAMSEAYEHLDVSICVNDGNSIQITNLTSHVRNKYFLSFKKAIMYLILV
jgi:hypothetical protein